MSVWVFYFSVTLHFCFSLFEPAVVIFYYTNLFSFWGTVISCFRKKFLIKHINTSSNDNLFVNIILVFFFYITTVCRFFSPYYSSFSVLISMMNSNFYIIIYLIDKFCFKKIMNKNKNRQVYYFFFFDQKTSLLLCIFFIKKDVSFSFVDLEMILTVSGKR